MPEDTAEPPTTDAPSTQSTSTASVGRSLVSLAGGAMGARLVAFFATTFLARVLGPNGFGVLGLGYAIANYVGLAIDGGINTVGAREVARAPGQAQRLAAGTILFRLVMAVGALAVLAVVALLIDKPTAVKLVLFLTGLTYVALALDTSWVHKGLERNRRVGVSLILAEVVYLIVLLAVVRGPVDVVWVPVALFIGRLAAALFLAFRLFDERLPRIEIGVGFRLFRDSSYLIGTKLMRTMFFSFDVVLLGFLISEYEVGLYNAAYRVCFVLTALAMAFMFSYLPAVTRAHERGPDAVGAVSTQSIHLSAAITLPLVVGGCLVAGPMLVLLFGAEYGAATLALQLLLPSVGLQLLRGTPKNVMIVFDRLKLDMWIMVSAVVLNVVLNVLLIPRYGLNGAAVATLAAEALALVLALTVMVRLDVRLGMNRLLRVAGACLLMAGAVLLAADLHVLLRIALGAVVYTGSLLALRGVPAEAQPVLRRLRKRLRRWGTSS